MCTRYLLLRRAKALAAALGLDNAPDIAPRYNAAPRQALPIVRHKRSVTKREATLVRWGFEPSGGADGVARGPLINARAETAAERPSFRDSFRTRRCAVPADGFYEWEHTGAGPMPWLFEPASGDELLLFAGLWTATPETAFTILTTGPNALIAPFHDRMPALIPLAALDEWLDPATPPPRLAQLLAPWPAEALRARPVHPRLNKATCDEPACLEPPPVTLRQLDLGFG
jgi:putative SOS response-associated peptidase YedK